MLDFQLVGCALPSPDHLVCNVTTGRADGSGPEALKERFAELATVRTLEIAGAGTIGVVLCRVWAPSVVDGRQPPHGLEVSSRPMIHWTYYRLQWPMIQPAYWYVQ